jgi:hypothetical protein
MWGEQLIGNVISSVSGFAGKFVKDSTKEMELDYKLQEIAMNHAKDGKMAEFNDIQQSRLMYAKEMEKAPWLIRLLNGIVRPFGGLGALATTFWVIWAPYFDYPKLTLPELKWDNPIWAIITSIISFYFVLRHKAQVAGVKDK